MLTSKRLVLAATIFAALAGSSAAQGPQSDARGSGDVYACINRANGQLRIVLPTESCRQNEVRVRLNLAGNPGPTGPQGPAGPAGPAGAQGATGAAGPQGAVGPQGPQGEPGAPGQDGVDGTNGTNGVTVPLGGIRGQLSHCDAAQQNFTGYLVHVPGRAFSVFTGSDGSFQIDNMPPGVYNLSIEKNGAAVTLLTGILVTDAMIVLPATIPVGVCEPTPECPNNCSGNGVCAVDGVCFCNAGFTGADCSVPATECTPGATRPCYDGAGGTENVGACTSGAQICTASGVWGACAGSVGPSVEICNGVDDDCDGSIDDGIPGLGSSCSDGVGACSGVGVIVCSPNGGLTCDAPGPGPSPESCNGIDDDCDGQIDEGNPGGGAMCSTGLPGACSAGTAVCTNGGLACQQATQAAPETCDGRDDNCNGSIDEGNPGGGAACLTGLLGSCSAGVRVCTNGTLACAPTAQPSAETCNGQDDNCNGTVDEGNPNGGAACTTGLPGICAAGSLSCQGGALACNQSQQARAELCNGLDDNCNGQIDDGVGTVFYMDSDGDGYGTSTARIQCGPSPPFTATQSGDCNDSNAAISPGRAEVCGNSFDDNCNGQVNENCTP